MPNMAHKTKHEAKEMRGESGKEPRPRPQNASKAPGKGKMKDSNFKPGLRAHPPFLLLVVWSFLNQVDTQVFKWKGAECQRCARQGQHVVGLEAWPSGVRMAKL